MNNLTANDNRNKIKIIEKTIDSYNNKIIKCTDIKLRDYLEKLVLKERDNLEKIKILYSEEIL
jgi:hypothetical protein